MAAIRLGLTAILCWLCSSGSALAWNATGHRVIASIAFRQLSDQERSDVVDLLSRHPRYAEDFDEKLPEEFLGRGKEQDRKEWLFQQAAVWPDLVRAGPKPLTAFHRGKWHYLHLPLFLSEEDRTEIAGRLKGKTPLDPPEDADIDTQAMNLGQALRFAKRYCSDKTSHPLSKAVMLSWLIHNVGDAHQPLHTSSLFSRRLFPDGDLCGSKIPVRKGENLHKLWDGLLGEGDYRESRTLAVELAADKEHNALGRFALTVPEEKQWLIESHNVARTVAYDAEILKQLRAAEADDGDLEPLTVSEAYLKVSRQVAAKRAVQAGFRLGAVLKAVVAE